MSAGSKNHFEVTSIVLPASATAPPLSAVTVIGVSLRLTFGVRGRCRVDGRKGVALKHPATLDRHAVVATDLDGGSVSNGDRSPKRGEFEKAADSPQAAIDPAEHINRQRRPAAMARLTRLAGLDDEDVRGRVTQNFERINAVIIRRFECRLAECRHYRRGQKRLGLDGFFVAAQSVADWPATAEDGRSMSAARTNTIPMPLRLTASPRRREEPGMSFGIDGPISPAVFDILRRMDNLCARSLGYS